ncbi:MAG: GNAT family N-acetyltransferase [Burkholderiales bacterium RIFCSPLOWO2_02_FULL_57_36]|nr:MAG: GNAT family N-acetyltransferase [Burkholderiales bacterium RIFCSPLOWO2_02_FULL_57_36]
MRLLMAPTDTTLDAPRLTLSFAATREEVREAQRLRYKVFVEAAGLPRPAHHNGLDQDEFDQYCDHLIVRDSSTSQVVGTYRVLGPDAARRRGRYYSEQEFDLRKLDHLRDRIAEAGRACIHPDYRSGGVIMLLWAGLAAFMERKKCDYLIGCASIGLAHGGHDAAAIYHGLNDANIAPPEYHVIPRLPYSIGKREPGYRPKIPPLIKGYLRSGAWVCGEPAWDPYFHCADLFMLLPLAKLDSRYARHYLREARAL